MFCSIINIRGEKMKEFISFIQDILMIKPRENRIGLSQFKSVTSDPIKDDSDISIKTKNVKLSDLMRRAS